jgi:hypothetical protein
VANQPEILGTESLRALEPLVLASVGRRLVHQQLARGCSQQKLAVDRLGLPALKAPGNLLGILPETEVSSQPAEAEESSGMVHAPLVEALVPEQM